MHLWSNWPYSYQRDVLRQHTIQAMTQLASIYNSLQIQVCKLLPSMHASVSPTATHDFYISTQQLGQALLNYPLYRSRIVLYLPAMVARPLVGNL